MNAKEILKEAFDSDIQLYEKCLKSDEQVLKMANEMVTAIWYVLVKKGIVTEEDIKTAQKEVKGLVEKI